MLRFDPSRRSILASGFALAAVAAFPPTLRAAHAGTRKLAVVLLRGGMDGLSALPPVADPAYATLRGALTIEAGSALPGPGPFGFHPALPFLQQCHAAGQLLLAPASAGPYRERSHFDAQNVLESGASRPYGLDSGWLNRLAGLLGGKAPPVALANAMPLMLRGPTDASNFAVSPLRTISEDLANRIARLYASEPILARAWAQAQNAEALTAELEDAAAGDGEAMTLQPQRRTLDPESTGKLAAQMLSQPDGPAIALLESDGWDTHTRQTGRLERQFAQLNALLAGLHAGLGVHWADTLILVVTEFGRTARANGTGGTDHGTGSLAMLLGGSIETSALIGSWPGLGVADLLDGRDGNDMLQGDSGHDLLEGGFGNARDVYDAQVFRIYQAMLAREPGDGLDFWAEQLFDQSLDVVSMAAGFESSTEFQTTYGGLSDSAFVNLLYNNVLGRDADPGGEAFWLNELSTGSTRAEVAAGFSESNEFVDLTEVTNPFWLSSGMPMGLTDDVFRLYRATLDRDPDMTGLMGWLNFLGTGQPKVVVAEGFVGSAEFQSVYGALSDGDFINLLYNNVLNRDADPGGEAFWLNEIANGATRAEVVLGFSDSAEFIGNTAEAVNTWMRTTPGTANDVLFGGADNDRVFGGFGADSFVFDNAADGSDFVGDVERWDTLVFNNFGYTDKADVFAHLSQVGVDVVFSDQGNTVTFAYTTLADLDHADMFSFDDTGVLG